MAFKSGKPQPMHFTHTKTISKLIVYRLTENEAIFCYVMRVIYQSIRLRVCRQFSGFVTLSGGAKNQWLWKRTKGPSRTRMWSFWATVNVWLALWEALGEKRQASQLIFIVACGIATFGSVTWCYWSQKYIGEEISDDMKPELLDTSAPALYDPLIVQMQVILF